MWLTVLVMAAMGAMVASAAVTAAAEGVPQPAVRGGVATVVTVARMGAMGDTAASSHLGVAMVVTEATVPSAAGQAEQAGYRLTSILHQAFLERMELQAPHTLRGELVQCHRLHPPS